MTNKRDSAKKEKRRWAERDLPFKAMPVARVVRVAPFDSDAWVKELLARPVSEREVQS